MSESRRDVHLDLLIVAGEGSGPDARFDAVIEPTIKELRQRLALDDYRDALRNVAQHFGELVAYFLSDLAVVAFALRLPVLISKLNGRY
jgi:hypothetical protein